MTLFGASEEGVIGRAHRPSATLRPPFVTPELMLTNLFSHQ
jgi:hypothetical protein